MLCKQRCPHTGVVNFFFAEEPHLAVGSVIKAEGGHYLWRYYAEPFASAGTEADMQAAEQRIAELSARAASRQSGTTRYDRAA